MTTIKRDVDFTVNVGDARITTAGFGVLACMAAHVRSKARVSRYTTQAAVEAAFPTIAGLVDPITLASAKAFAQKGEAGKLKEFAVIRQRVDNVVLTLPTAKAADRGDVLTVTVTSAIVGYRYIVDIVGMSGPVNYLAVTGDTVTTIAAALVALINAETGAVTAAAVAGGVFTLTADVADTAYTAAFWNWDNTPTTPDADDHTAQLFTVTGGYNLEISEVLHSITSSSAVITAAQIADAMATWANTIGGGGLLEYGATGNGDGTLDVNLTPVNVDYLTIVEGADFAITFDSGDADSTKSLGRGNLLYHAPDSAETVAQTFTAAADESGGNDTYCIGHLYVADADILVMAAAVSTLAKIHCYITEALDVGDPTDATDVMSDLQGLAYDRTFGAYRKDATDFFEFAWAADRLPTIPGSSTWKFKTLVGQTADDLTAAFEASITGKNGNVYTDQAETGTTAEGEMASGRFIDTQRAVDYVEARTDEAFIAALKAAPKISLDQYPFVFGALLDELYDLGGKFNSEDVTSALLDPVNQEFYRRTIPAPASLSTADKAARTVPGIIVETRFSGAVHKVTGTINVSI